MTLRLARYREDQQGSHSADEKQHATPLSVKPENPTPQKTPDGRMASSSSRRGCCRQALSFLKTSKDARNQPTAVIE
jgi:hypothetical protein